MYELTAPQLEVIKEAAAHLAKQRKKAIDAHGGCMYLTPDNLKCGVGALIPDVLYSSQIEGNCGGELIEKCFPAGVHLSHRIGFGAGLVLDWIQEYHDQSRYLVDIDNFRDQSDEEFAEHITDWISQEIIHSFNETDTDLEITE